MSPKVTFSYASSPLTTATDAAGQRTTFSYDSRATSSTPLATPASCRTTFSYDAQRQWIGVAQLRQQSILTCVFDSVAPFIGAAVQEAQRGNTQAKEWLLTQFQPLLMKCAIYAAQRLPHEERAVLNAEVRFLFLDILSQFESPRGVPFLAYIQRMLPQRVRNFVRGEWARLLREVSVEELTDEGKEAGEAREWLLSHQGSEEAYEEVALQMWLDEALETLPETQRQIMQWTMEGYTEREIALRLRLSQPSVHELKQKAQRKLQERWTEHA